MTRRQRIADAVVHRPFWMSPWHYFAKNNRRWTLHRWMLNPSQCRYEHSLDGLVLRDQLLGRLVPDIEPEQQHLWDTGLQAWESAHDPAEGL